MSWWQKLFGGTDGGNGNDGGGTNGGGGGNGGGWVAAAAADGGWDAQAAAAWSAGGGGNGGGWGAAAASSQDGGGNGGGWGAAAADGGGDAQAAAAWSQAGEKKTEANDPWARWNTTVNLSEDTVNREYTWFVDFRDCGKNFWLEYSEEHTAILEDALASRQETVELEHTYYTKKGKQHTTRYVINLIEYSQTSGDNNARRRVRRLRSCAQ